MNLTADRSDQSASPAGSNEPAGARGARLELRGITRRFGTFTALDSFDLTVEPGEFVTLLGPSGCGKSTALNCIAGLLDISAGEIWYDGRRVDRLSPERRGFGMVFQSYALFPHLTARRNVAFGLEVRRIKGPDIATRVSAALAMVRLDAQAHKYPSQLSGGQQQRVAIARALVLEPRLLLMDEPLSNLDAKLRVELRTEIKRIHQRLGLTTIYVTHDQSEALSLSDRVVVLRDGQVQQSGAPDAVYTRPANAFVADFMGYRNLIPVDVGATTGGATEVTAPGLRLRGTAIGRVAPAGRAVAAVRPEDIACRRDGGTLRGRVDVVEYQGRSVAADIVCEGGQRVYAIVEERLVPGDEVGLDIHPERLLIFPAEGPRPA